MSAVTVFWGHTAGLGVGGLWGTLVGFLVGCGTAANHPPHTNLQHCQIQAMFPQLESSFPNPVPKSVIKCWC